MYSKHKKFSRIRSFVFSVPYKLKLKTHNVSTDYSAATRERKCGKF